jgi:adenosylcobinamide-GDP ribazoletransferase
MNDQESVSAARPWAELRAPVAALTFLTRIPVGRWLVLDGDDVARAAPTFPLVGAGIGAVVGGIAAMLAKPLSALLAAGLALAVGAVLTGALHLDALADTADALGARSRERALEIMRDHSIGAYGAVAITLDLLIKVGALSALISHQHVVLFAVAAGALSRMSPVLLAAWLPYARAGPGAGVLLTRSGRLRAAVAVIVAVAIAVAAGGMNGVVVAGCAAAVTAALGITFRRWLGGITGDTLGAAVELSETTVLVVAVALVGAG